MLLLAVSIGAVAALVGPSSDVEQYRGGGTESQARAAAVLDVGPKAGSTPGAEAPAPAPAPPTTSSDTTATAPPSTDIGDAPAPPPPAPLPPASPPAAKPAVPAAPTAPAADAAPLSERMWLSGGSGAGVASGAFGAWRGSPVPIAGTWADAPVHQVQLYQLRAGGEYAGWNGSLDIAIGAIGEGESWAAAATGAYDARWAESLTNLRSLRDGRPGTVYLRFAHEMNGDWYPWAVDAGNHQDFIAAWQRFRTLQQQIFPAAQLVFCVNRESVGSGIDWRRTFPGAASVDVLSVDYYNHWPYVADAQQWTASLDDVDGFGAPKGLQAHLDFARQVGLPLAVSEWSTVASAGDSAAFITGMHEFFRANAGRGPGQVLFEIQFSAGGQFSLFGSNQMPSAAAAYRALF